MNMGIYKYTNIYKYTSEAAFHCGLLKSNWCLVSGNKRWQTMCDSQLGQRLPEDQEDAASLEGASFPRHQLPDTTAPMQRPGKPSVCRQCSP